MGAVGVTLSKKLSGNYSEIQIIAGYLVAMILVNPVLSFLAGESFPRVGLTIPWLAQLGYAASYLIANTAVVAGYKHLDPSIGALVGLLEVIFGAIFGMILFGEVITMQLILGGGLIILAMSLPDLARLWQRITD
jgi:drug/metabolite transporter (DMT)-like permease